MWELAKLLFDIYVKNYAHFERIYGSLGTPVVMLIWIYYSAFIILIGAEIGSNYEEVKRRLSTDLSCTSSPAKGGMSKEGLAPKDSS
jgi:membrane protein